MMVFGRRRNRPMALSPIHTNPPGCRRRTAVPQPPDVAWDSQGKIYITTDMSLSCCQIRQERSWVKSWGSGTGPDSSARQRSRSTRTTTLRSAMRYQRIHLRHRRQFLRIFKIEIPPVLEQGGQRTQPPPGSYDDGVGAPNAV